MALPWCRAMCRGCSCRRRPPQRCPEVTVTCVIQVLDVDVHENCKQIVGRQLSLLNLKLLLGAAANADCLRSNLCRRR
jgi:hypothetical protein